MRSTVLRSAVSLRATSGGSGLLRPAAGWSRCGCRAAEGSSLPVDRRCYAVSCDSFARRRGPSPETAHPPTALVRQHAPNSNPGVTRGRDSSLELHRRRKLLQHNKEFAVCNSGGEIHPSSYTAINVLLTESHWSSEQLALRRVTLPGGLNCQHIFSPARRT